jgi:branched-subunit amino acid ABC-type transport system permease component
MNLKRIFGAVLTALGIGELIYAAVIYINGSNNTNELKRLVVYGLLGLLFFIADFGLIRTTKDES